MLDISRTQSTLLDVFENKGKAIIEGVELLAQRKLRSYLEVATRSARPALDLDEIQEGFRIQEVVLEEIIDAADSLNEKLLGGPSKPEAIRRILDEERIKGAIVVESNGALLDSVGIIPPRVEEHIPHLLAKEGYVVFDLFAADKGGETFSIVGIKRPGSARMFAVILDLAGLKYKAARVVLQEAVDESGWRKGVYYFILLDERGEIIASGGDTSSYFNSKWKRAESVQGQGQGRRISEGAPRLMDVFSPLRLEGILTGTAHVALDIEEVYLLRDRNRRHIIISALLVMTALLAAAFFFYRLQIRHAEGIQEMRKKLAQAERLSSLGRLAAGFAHEIRNPLNAVSMAIQRIAREFRPAEDGKRDEFLGILKVIRDEIRRLDKIIEEFVSPARERQPQFREGRISDVLGAVLGLIREMAESRPIEISMRMDCRDAIVRMDASMMHQALLNILKNAVESVKGSGKIMVSCAILGKERLCVSIMDTGVGMDEDELERIFDFEYTTKEKGLGLGLPIAREIIEAHGGDIEVESKRGEGSLFKIVLPLVSPSGVKEDHS
jgi:signal transduction histidine kinase